MVPEHLLVTRSCRSTLVLYSAKQKPHTLYVETEQPVHISKRSTVSEIYVE